MGEVCRKTRDKDRDRERHKQFIFLHTQVLPASVGFVYTSMTLGQRQRGSRFRTFPEDQCQRLVHVNAPSASELPFPNFPEAQRIAQHIQNRKQQMSVSETET